MLGFAHVTTNAAPAGADDFEKGIHGGARVSLDVVEAFVAAWLARKNGE